MESVRQTRTGSGARAARAAAGFAATCNSPTNTAREGVMAPFSVAYNALRAVGRAGACPPAWEIVLLNNGKPFPVSRFPVYILRRPSPESQWAQGFNNPLRS